MASKMAMSIMFVAPLLGRGSMLLFIVFLFIGSIRFVTIGISGPAVLIWDGILSFVFFFQHSYMIRKHFQTRLSRMIPSHYAAAGFNLVSSIVLIAVVLLWQPSSTVVFQLDGLLRWSARGIFVAGIAGIGWGILALKFFDPFGSKAIRDHIRGKQPRPQKFSVQGPYLWVRHPLYFFLLLLIWSCPDLTLDRLFFNVLWTLWIYIGTLLEERDLVSDFGEDYRRYQRKTPMLIPWRRPLE